MIKKMLTQTALCVLVILVLFISKNSGLNSMEKGAEVVLTQMAVSYTVDDVKNAATKTLGAASVFTNKVGGSVDAITGKPVYGEPIDDKYQGNKTVVYAVAGGKVTAVGENEEIGRYIKIIHGDQAESLYGNLNTINVVVPEQVKKGQIIGIYDKSIGDDFYYSLKEFQ